MDRAAIAGPTLVLGAGMVGTFSARAIAAMGVAVAAADVCPDQGYFRSYGPSEDVPVLQLDINDQPALRRLIRKLSVQTLVLAAGMNRSAAHHDSRRARLVNVDAPRSVATAALECGVRHLVFTSSFAVYGPSSGQPITEAFPARPVSEYGQMKIAAEQSLGELRLQGLGLTILRLCGVYGPARHGTGGSHATRFFTAALAQLARTGRLVIRTPTVAVDEFLYVKDVARAVAMAATVETRAGGGVFNVGAGKAMTGGQVRDSLQQLFPGARIDVDVPLVLGDDRPRAALDTTRIRRELGFRPNYELTDGLADYLLELSGGKT